jgi:hypothetical protein
MNPLTILSLLDAGLTLVETLGPRIAALRANGEITAEQEAALQNRIDKIRSGEAFSGDHWKPTGN